MRFRPIWNPREMNVGNAGQPILTPAQLQQLTQLALNPGQMGTLGLNLPNNTMQSVQAASNNVVNVINGPMVSAQTSAQQTQSMKGSQNHMPNSVGIPLVPQPSGIPSLPWPVSNPVCHVPYFDMNMYRGVNMEALPSHDPSGMDLPLTDITTLRFFFNLGVQQSRNLVHARTQQQTLENLGALNPAAVINMVNSGSLNPNAVEQLNALIGQHNLLRQAQQIQAGPQHMRGQQMHQQMLQFQQQTAAQSHALQVIAAMQQQQQPPHQPQQHHQAATTPQNQDRKLSQADILAFALQPNPAAVSSGNQMNAMGIVGMPPAIVAPGNNSSSAPPMVPTPIAPIAQNPQKSFDNSFLFQQALLASSGQTAKSSLHDIRLQAIAQHQQQQQLLQQQQQPQSQQQAQSQPQSQNATSTVVSNQTVNLHPFIRPTETVKQVVSANGGEPSISPRPIPVDPSPPRSTVGNGVETTDVAVSLSSALLNKANEEVKTKQELVDESEQKSSAPGTSSSTPIKQSILHNPIGIANPMNVSTTPVNVSKSAPEMKGTSISSNHIPSIIQMSEQHFTETFQNSELGRKQNNANGGQAKAPAKQNGNTDDLEDIPALAPILMMTYLNTCMNQAKTQLNANGLHVGVDDNGQIVDFSSRPIDPIFKDAREDLAKSRDFRNSRKRSSDAGQSGVQQPSCSQGEAVSTSEAGCSVSSPYTEMNAKPASLNPLGINRSMTDAVHVASPNAGSSQEPIVIDEAAPEDDSEDDSVGGKRLRIATDEE